MVLRGERPVVFYEIVSIIYVVASCIVRLFALASLPALFYFSLARTLAIYRRTEILRVECTGGCRNENMGSRHRGRGRQGPDNTGILCFNGNNITVFLLYHVCENLISP